MGIDPMTARLDYGDDRVGIYAEQGTPPAEHLEVLAKAFGLHLQRTEAYGEVWKQYGALSNLLSAARKIDRLMNVWWRNDGSIPALHKDVLDDAYDAINYITFFIRNAQNGNIAGSVPSRPEESEVHEVVDWGGRTIARYPRFNEDGSWSGDPSDV